MKHFYTATDALSIDESQSATIQRYKDSNIYDVYDVYENDYDVDKNRQNKKELAAMYLKKMKMMKKMKNKKLSRETGDDLNKLWIYY